MAYLRSNMPTRITPATIAHYYDVNTTSFLNLGGSKMAGALHRQIWAPGVQTHIQAIEYLHQLVAGEVEPLIGQHNQKNGRLRLLDLGCGVGGAATWLVEHLPVDVTGVTISAVQVALARQRVEQLGVSAHCAIWQADFHQLPTFEPFQAAYAIESFAHARSADDFFCAISPQLLPGGRLIICDDFLATDLALSPTAKRWLRRFRLGWHLSNLITLEKAQASALSHGLHPVATYHLTTHLRLQSAWLGRFSYHALWPLRWSVIGQSWRGSAALQMCLRFGWSIYCVQVWQKE